MSDILVRDVDELDHRNLKLLAASIGVTLESLLQAYLSELAHPYDELREAVVERAQEVEKRKHHNYIVNAGADTVPLKAAGSNRKVHLKGPRE